MNLHHRIKDIREEKKLSQEYMANKLTLSQSQYSRREKGEVKFLADELLSIARILEVSVAQLYGEANNSFAVHTQNGGNFGQYISVPEKLIEQYEARLNEKDDLIQILKEKVIRAH